MRVRVRVGVEGRVGVRVGLGLGGATLSLRVEVRVPAAPGTGNVLASYQAMRLADRDRRAATHHCENGDRPVPDEMPRVRAINETSSCRHLPDGQCMAEGGCCAQSTFVCLAGGGSCHFSIFFRMSSAIAWPAAPLGSCTDQGCC